MSGKIKKIIEKIISEKAQGDPVLMKTTRLKLILKGINVDSFTIVSEDDPEVIAKLIDIAKEFKIDL